MRLFLASSELRSGTSCFFEAVPMQIIAISAPLTDVLMLLEAPEWFMSSFRLRSVS